MALGGDAGTRGSLAPLAVPVLWLPRSLRPGSKLCRGLREGKVQPPPHWMGASRLGWAGLGRAGEGGAWGPGGVTLYVGTPPGVWGVAGGAALHMGTSLGVGGGNRGCDPIRGDPYQGVGG